MTSLLLFAMVGAGPQTLLEAVRAGDVAAIDRLVAAGADVNADDGRDFGGTPLHAATTIPVAQALLRHGANINAENRLKDSPLQKAAGSASLAYVEFLVRKGAEVRHRDLDGNEPVHAAATYSNLPVLEYFLERQAIPVDTTNEAGETPLLASAYSGKMETITYLLSRKADPKAKDSSGRTMLHRAAKDGHLDVVKYWVNKIEIDLNTPDDSGQTPLHHAAFSHAPVVKFLLGRGAKPDVKDKGGRRPIDFARGMRNAAAVALLEGS